MEQEIRCAFPPRAVPLCCSSCALSEAGVGDTVCASHSPDCVPAHVLRMGDAGRRGAGAAGPLAGWRRCWPARCDCTVARPTGGVAPLPGPSASSQASCASTWAGKEACIRPSGHIRCCGLVHPAGQPHRTLLQTMCLTALQQDARGLRGGGGAVHGPGRQPADPGRGAQAPWQCLNCVRCRWTRCHFKELLCQ